MPNLTPIANFAKITLAALALASPLLHAQSVTGTVTNKTAGKPAAGDDVVLIKLANGMQEADRTKTDARGRFTLPVDDPGMHLVRVTHAKVPYFQPVPPGTKTADIGVYDSSDKVAGIAGEADVMRLQAGADSLEVTELFAVQNSSSPARTQFGARAFEIFLPAQAKITSGAALGPGGMPIQAQPVPTGEPGHFAFVFPIRPGETRFQVVYSIPYSGSYKFAPRVSVPMQNLAIMLPKTMKFEPEPGTAFQPVNDDVNAQVFLVKDAAPSQPLGFTASGTGQMPKDTAGAAGDGATAPASSAPDTAAAASAAAAADTRPGGGLGNPIDTPDPLHKYRWWILGGIAAFFAAGIAFAMRRPTTPRADPMDYGLAPGTVVPAARPQTQPASAPAQGSGVLSTLKEELFQLETDRVEGRITEEQYVSVKAALETVLRHALKKTSAPAGTSNS